MSLALVPPAAAQNEDPQVDPDSPAGTEYQLPIDRAREEASGGSGSSVVGSSGSSRSADTAPLFGAGVERSRSDSNTKSRSGSGGGEPAVSDEQSDTRTRSPKTVLSQASTPDGGGRGLAAIGAGAAGVLLVGGFAGLAWRRRRSQGTGGAT